MTDKKQKKIEKVVKEFFKKTNFEVNFEVEQGREQDNAYSVLIETAEPQFLIGRGGRTLSDLQNLLGRIIRRVLEEPVFINLDINQYKENKTRYLKEMARGVADELAIKHQAKELPPMNGFERRVIHLALSERQDVITESRGIGEERRVVVKPA